MFLNLKSALAGIAPNVGRRYRPETKTFDVFVFEMCGSKTFVLSQSALLLSQNFHKCAFYARNRYYLSIFVTGNIAKSQFMEEYGLEISDFVGDAAFDCVGKNFLFASKVKSIPQKMFNTVLRFEAAFYCRKGSFRIEMGNVTYYVRAGEILTYTDGMAIRGSDASDDAEITVWGCSWDLLREVKDVHLALWPVTDYVINNPITTVKPSFAEWFDHYLQRLKYVCDSPVLLLKKELISTLFLLMIYEFVRMIADRVGNIPSQARGRCGEIYHEFFNILITSYGRTRSIADVAAAIHISPKYLSRVIKETAGERAMFYIHKYAMRAIGLELKYTDKTIKQIATQQEFPSLAAFGKYVKAQTGMSPTDYRQKLKTRQVETM